MAGENSSMEEVGGTLCPLRPRPLRPAPVVIDVNLVFCNVDRFTENNSNVML